MGRKVRDISFIKFLKHSRYFQEVRLLRVTLPVSFLVPVFAPLIKTITLLFRYKSMDL